MGYSRRAIFRKRSRRTLASKSFFQKNNSQNKGYGRKAVSTDRLEQNVWLYLLLGFHQQKNIYFNNHEGILCIRVIASGASSCVFSYPE